MIPLPQSGVFSRFRKHKEDKENREKSFAVLSIHDFASFRLSAIVFTRYLAKWHLWRTRRKRRKKNSSTNNSDADERGIEGGWMEKLREAFATVCTRQQRRNDKKRSRPNDIALWILFVRVFDEREIDEGEFSMQHTQSQSRQPSLLFAALRNIFPSTFLWHHEPGFTPNETLP